LYSIESARKVAEKDLDVAGSIHGDMHPIWFEYSPPASHMQRTPSNTDHRGARKVVIRLQKARCVGIS
jgi:uncharacterized protein YijF (DUF1287 family)